MTITEFLLARIAEDEAVIEEHAQLESAINYVGHGPDLDGTWVAVVDGSMDNPTIGLGPGRFRAECEAKRRIVNLHVGEVIEMEGVIVLSICEVCHNSEMHTAAHWPCATIKAIASIYAYHPDFREEWR